MRALVTDTHVRSAVAGIRALGHAGIPVVAHGSRRSAAGLWSRYATERAVGADAAADPQGFAASVGREIERHGPVVVYPGQESAIDPVVQAAQLVPGMLLPYPGPNEPRALRDKRTLPLLAERAGLDAPRTLLETLVGELNGQSVPVPCIVKRTKVGGQARARVVVSEGELRSVLSGLPDDEMVMLQERAHGPLIGLAIVIDRDGDVVARFQQVSVRTWPPDAGGSSLAVGTAPDDELTRSAARVLKEAGYWGLAQFQFLRTERGLALIDVNPRYYGSMPLALASGVNLAAAWHAVATAGPRPPVPSDYRIGVSYRSLRHDLAAAVRGSPRLLLQRPPRPASGAMWAPDDPGPSALLAVQAVASPLGRGLRRAKRP
jgi:predicted ATP-grasp superfamily ATP-dependent carboligase